MRFENVRKEPDDGIRIASWGSARIPQRDGSVLPENRKNEESTKETVSKEKNTYVFFFLPERKTGNDIGKEDAMVWEQAKRVLKDIYYHQGRTAGVKQGKQEDALAMMEKGFDISVISEITGLPEETVDILQKKKTESGIQS